MRKRWLLMVWCVLAIAILAAAPQVGSSSLGETRELVISATAFNYSPHIIHVNKGDRLKVTLIADDVSHGFYLDGYDVDIIARPKENATAEFVVDRPGQFRFRCSETCGPMHPFMIGVLVVEPNSPRIIAYALAALTTLGALGFLWVRKEV